MTHRRLYENFKYPRTLFIREVSGDSQNSEQFLSSDYFQEKKLIYFNIFIFYWSLLNLGFANRLRVLVFEFRFPITERWIWEQENDDDGRNGGRTKLFEPSVGLARKAICSQPNKDGYSAATPSSAKKKQPYFGAKQTPTFCSQLPPSILLLWTPSGIPSFCWGVNAHFKDKYFLAVNIGGPLFASKLISCTQCTLEKKTKPAWFYSL